MKALLSPLKTVMPLPIWAMLPLPEKVCKSANEFERFTLRVPEALTSTSPLRFPVVPPSPICSVPASITVLPAKLSLIPVSTVVPPPI